MRKPSFLISLLVLACLSGAIAVSAGERSASAVAPPAYASGGIGDDDPLLLIAGDYNLQLVFATQGRGEYLAGVEVLIADAAGRSLLEAVSPGPLFYVRLPPGGYRVTAAYGGKPLHRSVVLTDRRRPILYFYWPGEDAGAEN